MVVRFHSAVVILNLSQSIRYLQMRTDRPLPTYTHSEMQWNMVLSLAAYVYASIRTEDHEFDSVFAFVLFVADSFIASAFVPNFPI
jgi:hypothetical protein